tara:strand:- start:687 stop:1136 length:450 start_codon:yes stop_codon:yes gene_type:complete
MRKEYPAKQVIVLRRDLNMRKGKMVAQGAHASMAVILDALSDWTDLGKEHGSDFEGVFTKELALDTHNRIDNGIYQWLTDRFAKICCYVNSEEELVTLYNQAKEAGLPCSIITDAGFTEFKGVPTKTAVAIGPALIEDVDKITKHLKLL